MQKFVPRNRVRIFGNEHSWSSPLDPKLMFWWILLCSGAFGTISTSYETRFKMGWTGIINAKVRAMKLGQNISQRTHPIHPHGTLNSCFGVLRTVWVHLGLFHRLMKLGSKQAELVRLMQKFVPWNCVRTFHNERSWSAPLDSKLMFWCVLLCLGAFGTVSMPYKTRFKMGRTGIINAKVRAMKSGQNISQRTHPILPMEL
jgi:hypothetical protein